MDTEPIQSKKALHPHTGADGHGISGEQKKRSMKLIKEPFFHFLLLGVLILVLYHLTDPHPEAKDLNTIHISSNYINALIKKYTAETNTRPSTKELTFLIENAIRDEVLIREALKRGIDKGDAIIQKRLVKKMEFIIESMALRGFEEPDEQLLKAYYQKNSDQFKEPVRISFSHIFFSKQLRGDRTYKDAQSFLAGLDETERKVMVDPFIRGNQYKRNTYSDIATVFGPAFSERLRTVKMLNQWTGPIESIYGHHLVKITETIPERQRRFTEVREAIYTSFKKEKLNALQAQLILELTNAYDIRIAEGDLAQEILAKKEVQNPEDRSTKKNWYAEANLYIKRLLKKPLTFYVLVTIVAVSFVLGGLHAVQPGHGKTLVAAYLVGAQGTVSHAILLGMVVTISHTFSVIVLGSALLYLSQYVVPDQISTWMNIISGFLIMIIGLGLFLRAYRAAVSQDGYHFNGSHGHSHGVFQHHHHDHHPDTKKDLNLHSGEPVSIKRLLSLGIVGGIVPCPDAIIILLIAITLNKIALGLLIIIVFSFGIASTLIMIGILIVKVKSFADKLDQKQHIVNRLPILSSLLIIIIGLIILIQSLMGAGIVAFKI